LHDVYTNWMREEQGFEVFQNVKVAITIATSLSHRVSRDYVYAPEEGDAMLIHLDAGNGSGDDRRAQAKSHASIEPSIRGGLLLWHQLDMTLSLEAPGGSRR
jgi:hypothetical protein